MISRARQPVVTVDLLIPNAGAFFDPPGKPGVAALVAALLPEGTRRRSAREIAEAIDFVGGSLSTTAESDATSVVVTVVKRDFPLAMDLLSDIVLHPALSAEELERKRRQALSNLEVGYADAAYLAQVTAARALFGLHPYGLPEDGTPESLRAIRRDDLVEFQKSRFVPQGALLAISGDVTPEEAFAAAEKFFGAWAGVPPAFTAPAIPEPPAGLRFVLVDKPDAVQTQIRISRIAVQRNSSDYLPLYVANRVFGGGFNSRLNTRIRQKEGLTYGATSQLASRARAGSLLAGLATRTDTTLESLRLLLDLLAQMGSGVVAPQELRFAQDYLVGSFPMQSETPEQIAGRVLALSLYGLPAGYYQTYRENIQAVTTAQLKTLVPRYFGASNLSIVLVGNLAAFRGPLKQAYPDAQYEEVPAADLDLLAADLHRKPSSDAPDSGVPAATPDSLQKGRELLSSAAKIAGGEALAAVKTVDVAAKGKLYQQVGDDEIALHLQVSYPDSMRLEMKLPNADITQGFDGRVGWLQFPGGVSEASSDAVSEFRRSILLTGGLGLVSAAQSGVLEVQYLGEEELEGKKTLAALWKGPSGPVRLYLDPASRLLVAARFVSSGQRGAPETLQVWDDYRPVETVQFPFHSVTYQNGVRHSEIFVQEVRFNQPMDPALFSKPAS
ncbi:MAG TPA: insulinase family protein [Candidatus Binatia bacterium]|nr:insulinase family protein [Candidatus Binatia bacterium]